MNSILDTLTYTILFILATYFTAISVVEWVVPSGNYPWEYPIAAILTFAAAFTLHYTIFNTKKENT